MGFSTLAGLVLFAASDPVDLRKPSPGQAIVRLSPTNLLQRWLAVVKSSY